MTKRFGKAVLSFGLWILAIVGTTALLLYLLLNAFTSREPVNLAVDGRGNLYVSDLLSREIRKFTSEGEYKATFGGKELPFGIGQDYPHSHTIDQMGNLYLLSDRGVITRFNPQGAMLLFWSVPKNATAIAADSSGNIIVNNAPNAQFQKFDPEGNLLKEWVTPHPLIVDNGGGLVLDGQNNMYVTDAKNKILYKYDSDGNLLSTIKGISSLGKVFAIDRNGYIYTFSSEAVVQKWDWNGTLVKTWGGRGSAPGQFEYKYSFSNVKGIVTDSLDQIYILYKNNDQAIVQQYTTDGKFIRRWTDGFPGGTWYLFQLLFVFMGIFLLAFVAKAASAGKPTSLLNPVPLPKQIVAGIQIPELLRDNIGTITKPEEKEQKQKRKTKQKPDTIKADLSRTYLEQALGTFTTPETIRPNGKWSIRLRFTNHSALWIHAFSPFAMFLNGWIPQFNQTGWWLATLFMATLFGIFASIVFWTGRKSSAGRYRLTRNDITQLLGINLLAVIVYGVLAYTIQNTGKVVFGSNDIDNYVISYNLIFIIIMITGFVGFYCTIVITRKCWLNAPYNAGKYELTLRRAGAMRRIFNTVGLWVLEAEAYRRMGKLDEAEKVYYEALTQAAHQEATPAALLLEGLALVRMEQERYPESLYLLEKSYDLNPERNSPLIYGAENYIRARLKNERAWELLEQAKNINEISALKAIRLSLEALLLGREKWFDQAEYFIKNALNNADPKFKPGIADIHLRAAAIADMQGNDAAALEHYRQVQLNDPFGVNGTRASRILRFSATPAKEPVILP
jgi:tetratricopeptide (TPR) repeat protein